MGVPDTLSPPNLLSQGGLVLRVPVQELHDVQQALDIPGERAGYPPREGAPRGPPLRPQGAMALCPMQEEGLSTPNQDPSREPPCAWRGPGLSTPR